MSIIAIANQKGGVGKTTLAVHLAYWLAQQGHRVIIVDADPQGNATAWAVDGDLSVDGMWRILVGREPVSAVVQPSKWEGVSILPGNATTGEAMTVLSTLRRPFDTVAKALRPLNAMADYVFIDMPPSRAAGFHETLFAADYLLVPTQLERLALQGVTLMADTVRLLAQEFDRAPALLGIVPNMVRKQTLEHQENLRILVEHFGQLVWPPIPLTVRLAEASAYGETIFDLEPNKSTAQSLAEIGQRIIENLEGGVK
jgi:chromosome partitioning protein